jgi:hypothetical protein
LNKNLTAIVQLITIHFCHTTMRKWTMLRGDRKVSAVRMIGDYRQAIGTNRNREKSGNHSSLVLDSSGFHLNGASGRFVLGLLIVSAFIPPGVVAAPSSVSYTSSTDDQFVGACRQGPDSTLAYFTTGHGGFFASNCATAASTSTIPEETLFSCLQIEAQDSGLVSEMHGMDSTSCNEQLAFAKTVANAGLISQKPSSDYSTAPAPRTR